MPVPVNLLKTDRLSVDLSVDLEKKLIGIRVMGMLDEKSDLRKIASYVSKQDAHVRRVVFDLEGISGLNSSGTGAWILLLENLGKARMEIAFSRVSETFLEIASMHGALLGPLESSISEIEAPYFCETCQKREGKWLKVEEIDRSSYPPRVPVVTCATCSKTMEFDEIPGDFFGFLRRR